MRVIETGILRTLLGAGCTGPNVNGKATDVSPEPRVVHVCASPVAAVVGTLLVATSAAGAFVIALTIGVGLAAPEAVGLTVNDLALFILWTAGLLCVVAAGVVMIRGERRGVQLARWSTMVNTLGGVMIPGASGYGVQTFVRLVCGSVCFGVASLPLFCTDHGLQ